MNLFDSAVRVRKETGKSMSSQLSEVLRLRLSKTALSPSEYYEYHLYRDTTSFANKREYLGWRKSRELDSELNLDSWRACANDKLLCHILLRGLEFPLPTIRAIYNKSGRQFGNAISLADIHAVGDYVRNDASFPLFVKPIVGSFGRGAIQITGYDRNGDHVELANGETVHMDKLLHNFDFEPFNGQLFQEVLKPHPKISERCGNRICSVRITVVLRDGGPRILYTVWKIATGRNMTDNLAGGKIGNLTGWVNPETGVVERVARGMSDDYVEVATHPDSGERLLGFQLPDWTKTLALCLNAASALPGLRLQNWDIALCDTGPVILEVNTESDFGPDQLYGQRGFFSALHSARQERL
jgi:hypothetical protein